MNPNMQQKNNYKNKGRYIQFRLNEEIYQQIDEFSRKFHISKSELARRSISKYILIFDNPEHPNPKLLFSQNMLKILIDNVSSETIENLAKISYENGMADVKFITQNVADNQISTQFKFGTFYERLISLSQVIFSKEMQNWFDECDVSEENNNYVFKGTHYLGQNFSFFIKELLKLYSGSTKYELKNEYYGELIEKTKLKNQKMYEQRKFSVKFMFGLRD